MPGLPTFDFQHFCAVLTAEDELGRVIRAHIYIEHLLVQLIEATVTNPAAFEQWRRKRLGYDGCVRLAQVLGLPDHFARSLSELGTLRNRFAHNLDFKLAAGHTEALHETFNVEYKRQIDLFARVFDDERRKFKSLPPKDQFTLCATGIIVALAGHFRHVVGRAHKASRRLLLEPVLNENLSSKVQAEGMAPSSRPLASPTTLWVAMIGR